MAMRTGSRTRFPMEQKYRNTGIAAIGAYEFMRTADKRQIVLTDVVHPAFLLGRFDVEKPPVDSSSGNSQLHHDLISSFSSQFLSASSSRAWPRHHPSHDQSHPVLAGYAARDACQAFPVPESHGRS